MPHPHKKDQVPPLQLFWTPILEMLLALTKLIMPEVFDLLVGTDIIDDKMI